MRVRALISVGLVVCVSSAEAGGLFLPGSGAISTSRAGAAVASADDGEALSINPAGLAKSRGTTITISMALIRYYMQFTRRGSYDQVSDDVQAYEGRPYETVENQPKPPLGIGSVQPIPVIAIVTSLGAKLRVAAGLYAPNAYPFRDMSNGYEMNATDPSVPPPPSRYDVMKQESQLLFPSLAAAYRVTPALDLGARFSFGRAKSKSTVFVWGTTGNVDESVRHDTQFTAEVEDGFVPTFGVGVAYRPTSKLELGAVYNSAAVLRTKGTARTIRGPGVDPSRMIGASPDGMSRCEPGGTAEVQKACISLQLPMNAAIGARYKLLDDNRRFGGDLELNVGWENWGKRCDFTSAGIAADPECTSPGQFLINLDTAVYGASGFDRLVEINSVNLGLQDTYSVRLGGSLRAELYSRHEIILRGGVSFDTRAAREGWLRASFDGAARLTSTLGVGYRTARWELDVGAGYVFEGSTENGGARADGTDCNPTSSSLGCANGQDRPLDDRVGPDPTNPLLQPEFQAENPINQGTFESHYLLMMLGFSTWF